MILSRSGRALDRGLQFLLPVKLECADLAESSINSEIYHWLWIAPGSSRYAAFAISSRQTPLAVMLLAFDGAIADVAPVLHQIPMNGMHQLISFALRRADG